MHSESQSKLLILAHTIEHALSLLKAIIKSLPEELNQQLQSEVDIECDTTTNLKSMHNCLHLSTKYYDVRIQVLLARYDYFLGDGEVHNIEDQIDVFKEQHNITILDGVFFVTQVVQPTKILGFHDFVRVCDTLLSTCSPNLQAVVYDRPTSMVVDKQHVAEQEGHLESYVESIYEDLVDYKITNQSGRPLQDAEDSAGLVRIIEILECTLWLAMVKKEPKQSQQQEEKKNSVNLMKENFEEEDIQMDDLAKILNEMRDMKTNTTNLGDDARRTKAENLINQLMKACDFQDEEATSSDEEQ